jgi:hypothetical protein
MLVVSLNLIEKQWVNYEIQTILSPFCYLLMPLLVLCVSKAVHQQNGKFILLVGEPRYLLRSTPTRVSAVRAFLSLVLVSITL